MSKARVIARPPSSAISAATRSSFSAVRPLSTTVAPSEASSCATQRPMPLPPPVTQMHLPGEQAGAQHAGVARRSAAFDSDGAVRWHREAYVNVILMAYW